MCPQDINETVAGLWDAGDDIARHRTRFTSRDVLSSTIPRTYNHCYLSFQSEELK